MTQPLWKPPAERVASANITTFMGEINREYCLQLVDYWQLHQWSIANPAEFWSFLAQYDEIKFHRDADHILKKPNQIPGAQWFSGSTLNFAENLLRRRDNHTALVFRGEDGERRTLSYAELYKAVAELAQAFREMGLQKGDRVAGFMPNTPEAIISMLATTTLGGVWSSCSPDFGLNGAIDRFGQIEPKILLSTDGYRYNGKVLDNLEKVKEIEGVINSIERIIIVPFVSDSPDIEKLGKGILWSDFVVSEATDLDYTTVNFNDPLYIMYSSGTTGVPKCIVHNVGGTLLQHRKEHLLHTDIKEDDVIFYYTTCGWMMWNWLVSSLASGCTLVLFDGSPFFPQPKSLMDMAEDENITIFGTSAKYIAALEKSEVKPRISHNLSSLRTILSTGSPLSHESYDYVYRDIKEDVCLSSISGGTDILSCFALGAPILPVYRGELQCPGLGMDVHFFDTDGNSLLDEKGELVCLNSFPSMPIGFWNDANGERYQAAYFSTFPNCWCHGDYGERTSNGGIIIHGRADAVLNPGGVRIGTAEIYRQVEKIPHVLDSICIGQEWQDDVRVILFVKLQHGVSLDEALVSSIRQTIRTNTTPRHVPAKVIAVADIPRTISGKIVELAVRNIVHNIAVKNTDALANPEALEFYRDLPELRKE